MQEPKTAEAPPEDIQHRLAYRLIAEHYGNRRAERSQVPLINHIHEGYVILKRIRAHIHAIEAFFIHPILQADEDLARNRSKVSVAASSYGAQYQLDPQVILLAMEYRNIANAFLSDKVYEAEYTRGHYEIVSVTKPALSPLKDVNDMLIADKVQNRKDFLRYHNGTHQRSRELDYYFNLWLEALGISEDRYTELVEGL